MADEKPYAAWHVIYNLDGSCRGHEWALDEDGNRQPPRVYAQEHRDENGKPLPVAAEPAP